MIFYIIILLIDLLMIYHIRTCVVLTKTRQSSYDHWKCYDWVVTSEHYKISRITAFFVILLSLIPIVNAFFAGCIIVFYIAKRIINPQYNYGDNLTVTKLVPRKNKLIDWLIEKV